MADLTWIVDNHRLQITSADKTVWTEPYTYTKLCIIAGSGLVGGMDQLGRFYRPVAMGGFLPAYRQQPLRRVRQGVSYGRR